MRRENKALKRRDFIKLSAGAVGGAVVLAACTPATPTPAPTAVPAQPKATEPPAAPPTQAPTVVKATEPPAKAQDSITLRVGCYEFADRTWYREGPKWWAEQNPGINVEVEVIVYAESMTRALTGMATNTLPDVFSAPNRWGPYAAYKGVFMFLDDLVQTKDPGLDDLFDAVIDGASFEGKLWGIPNQLHPGRPTAVFYNKDLLAEKGVPEPTDDWTMDEFAEMASKITDRTKRTFGSSYYPTVVHDFCVMARHFGGDHLSDDRKSFLITTDQGAQAAARWQVDLRTKWDALPGRQEMEGLQFQAGTFGFHPNAVNVMKGLITGIGDKFKWDVVLAPTGPTGLRGAAVFVDSVVLAHNCRYPQEGYDLAVYLGSYEVQKRVLLEQSHNPARKSLYLLEGAHPIWKRTHDWLVSSKAKSTWPMPYNLLFEELNDTFVNNITPVWYAEVDFGPGIQKVQEECQKVLDKPRQ